MRARADPLFSNFLLRVGNRVKEAIDGSYIRIPGDMAIPYTDDSNSRDDLINAIFPSLETNAHSSEYIISRAILSTKTRMLMRLMINSSVDFTERRKFIIVLDEVEDDNNNFYPMEFSNSLNPRITLCPSEDDMFPFKLKSKQFPVELSFAMTINKAQGQTIPKVGVYHPDSVFSHG
ncbi:ATP-dependent DNA helicase PIF1-like protein [Tanacetum coccineum]